MKKPRIVVFGGTGFVGRHLVPELQRLGYPVCVPSRNRERNRELFVLPGVQVVNLDLDSGADLRRALEGAHAAINLIGILNETGRNGQGFERAHVDFTQRLIDACRAAGVRRLLQMSALNAGRGTSHYLRTRGVAEECVQASGLEWTIFQPSVIFGPGDGLFERFAGLLRLTPVLPLARADTRFAPVYVGDVVQAFLRALGDTGAVRQRYEIYGPEVLNLAEIVRYTAQCLGLKRWVLPLPDALARLQAALMDFVPGKPFSSDNFRSLALDSVGGIDGLYRLGIEKTPISAIVPQQLGLSPAQRRYDRWRRERLP